MSPIDAYKLKLEVCRSYGDPLSILQATRKIVEEEKKAVIDWMDAEAKQFRLATNGQAPRWMYYQAALEFLGKLREEFGA